MGHKVSTTERRGIPILAPEGELDLASIDALSRPLESATRDGGPVVLDLTGTEFIDSMTIAAIVKAAHETNTVRPIQLHVAVSPRTQPGRVWSITGLADFIPTFPSVEAALEGLAAKRAG